ncbi:MFS general substrate transporter [Lojkania enalia]|uniref:MFS general substrate transporter n=1 Tax=Lojkania enalia TaxID=147567 RepID=A0A9P4N2L9_9PLEO|nr:MFS general substrate transporter [Didymosphaeria enalia]
MAASAPELSITRTPEIQTYKPTVFNQINEKADEEKAEKGGSTLEKVHLTAWRLHLVTLGVCCSVFLPSFEITVVSTALVDIADDLRAFSRVGWVIVAYLAAYTSMIIISAKMSDIIGRKTALVASLIVFSAFSGGCGGAQTLTQLIVLRAFQGVGGAGCFSVASIVVFEMVPKQMYPKYSAIISAIVALATLLGPILGGLITEKSTWRWVFLVNVPVGVTTTALLGICLPTGFPYQGQKSAPNQIQNSLVQNLRRMDFLGTFLFMGASFTFVTALLEASTSFSWSSAPTIVLLVISGVLAIAFLAWERFIMQRSSLQEPIFPWRFVYNRAWMGMLFSSLLLGIPFAVLVVSIPQKLQTISNLSPLQAGLRLLPYALSAPSGASLSNILISRRKSLPPVYITILGSCIQLIGISLLTVYSSENGTTGRDYGCQIVAGFGLGMMFGTLVMLTPLSVDMQDLATATGAIVQFRIFGSTIGLSIATSVLNAKLRAELPRMLSPEKLEAVLRSTTVIHKLPGNVRSVVEDVFGEGYALQLKVVVAFAAVNVLTTCMVWRKKPVKVA